MAKENDNPVCPHCGARTQKNGSTKAGTPRYRCRSSKHPLDKPRTFTIDGKRGRPTIGDKPMSPAERKRRQRG